MIITIKSVSGNIYFIEEKVNEQNVQEKIYYQLMVREKLAEKAVYIEVEGSGKAL